jgi:hypothetical protein
MEQNLDTHDILEALQMAIKNPEHNTLVKKEELLQR